MWQLWLGAMLFTGVVGFMGGVIYERDRHQKLEVEMFERAKQIEIQGLKK